MSRCGRGRITCRGQTRCEAGTQSQGSPADRPAAGDPSDRARLRGSPATTEVPPYLCHMSSHPPAASSPAWPSSPARCWRAPHRPPRPSRPRRVCVTPKFSQIFLPWKDSALYTLSPGGNFEQGSAGWGLSGGTRIVAGNETFFVGGTGHRSSLSVPTGGAAVSTQMCIDRTYPSFRFFARNRASRHGRPAGRGRLAGVGRQEDVQGRARQEGRALLDAGQVAEAPSGRSARAASSRSPSASPRSAPVAPGRSTTSTSIPTCADSTMPNGRPPSVAARWTVRPVHMPAERRSAVVHGKANRPAAASNDSRAGRLRAQSPLASISGSCSDGKGISWTCELTPRAGLQPRARTPPRCKRAEEWNPRRMIETRGAGRPSLVGSRPLSSRAPPHQRVGRS